MSDGVFGEFNERTVELQAKQATMSEANCNKRYGFKVKKGAVIEGMV